ncbi:MAG: N-acetylmuramoyl-L-alanine amidase [Eubacteriales bacterium]|nr:N-acetylmuramoyl-L-alanine amidase [Eubacteriales bacterium]
MRREKRTLEFAMTLLILLCSFYIGRLGAGLSVGSRAKTQIIEGQSSTEGAKAQANAGASGEQDNTGASKKQENAGTTVQDKITVVVDAGHGGIDAGKVGINGALEKEINLAIAGKLKTLLEQQDVTVVMTRETDNGLYDEGEANKKQQDMKRRCAMIDETEAVLAVSIHQNSYTQESVCGPQVFFYENSAQGRKLASILQEALNAMPQVERAREIKPNDSYYILRKTQTPTVIVECGFLSNAAEAERLSGEEYQETVAEAVCAGIVEYIREG